MIKELFVYFYSFSQITQNHSTMLSNLIRGQRSIITKNFARPLSTSKAVFETFTVQDEEDFKEKVINSQIPVIVDFSATWCGPCKILGPRLEAAVAATNSKVNLAIVDIDVNGDLAMDHEVQAVPTVVAFKEGKMVDKFIGLLDEDKLDAFVTKLHQ